MARSRLPKHAQNILQDTSPSPSLSYSFSRKRTARGGEKQPLNSFIFVADGQTVSQDPNLPVRFGQVAFREFPLQTAISQPSVSSRRSDTEEVALATGEGEADPTAPSDLCFEPPEIPSANTRKRSAQMA
ncbi:hypothetical protein V5O48_018795 [Marasmius crinis-equi]|uniref:Uncharacterized protein n=1 Tax=Marasmius crinis-equi TaxID=585013 RepID=A0ABR3EK50_9AGAR